jgi:hypothetical protein
VKVTKVIKLGGRPSLHFKVVGLPSLHVYRFYGVSGF